MQDYNEIWLFNNRNLGCRTKDENPGYILRLGKEVGRESSIYGSVVKYSSGIVEHNINSNCENWRELIPSYPLPEKHWMLKCRKNG